MLSVIKTGNILLQNCVILIQSYSGVYYGQMSQDFVFILMLSSDIWENQIKYYCHNVWKQLNIERVD